LWSHLVIATKKIFQLRVVTPRLLAAAVALAVVIAARRRAWRPGQHKRGATHNTTLSPRRSSLVLLLPQQHTIAAAAAAGAGSNTSPCPSQHYASRNITNEARFVLRSLLSLCVLKVPEEDIHGLLEPWQKARFERDPRFALQ
jgi:hypothetical protein